ncbi:MAG: hypothetical protein CMB65_03940 [Euryarchaeota archaeon]|nr:hypothetical protein [Euryarchaeota archaeon]
MNQTPKRLFEISGWENMVQWVEKQTLGEFCEDYNHYLKIPKLQRQFVWGEKEIRQLMSDIEYHRVHADELDRMFLGSTLIHHEHLVLNNNDGVLIKRYSELRHEDEADIDEYIAGMDGVEQLQDLEEKIHYIERQRQRSKLIDGQQRLSVLSILCRIAYERDTLDNAFRQRLKSVYWNKYTEQLRISHTNEEDYHDYSKIFEEHTQHRTNRCNLAYCEWELQDAENKLAELNNELNQITDGDGEPLAGQEGIVAAKKLEIENQEGDKTQLEENLQQAITAATISWSNGDSLHGDVNKHQTEGRAKNPFKDAYESLCGWVQQKSTEELEVFLTYVLDRLTVVVITIVNAKQVHLVFRSLNSLGKKLTISEKIKCDIFGMAVMAGCSDVIETSWGTMEDTFETELIRNRKIIDQFLWMYCRAKGIAKPPSSASGSKLSEAQVYDVFNDGEFQHDEDGPIERGLYLERCRVVDENGVANPDAERLTDFVSELNDYATAYVKILKPRRLNIDTDISAFWLHEIVDLQSLVERQLRPYFLAAFMKTIHNGRQHTVKFQNIVRAVSTVVTRLMFGYRKQIEPEVKIGRTRPNDLENSINDWIKILNNIEDIDVAITSIEFEVKKLINRKMGIIGESEANLNANPNLLGAAWAREVDKRFYDFLVEDLILKDPNSEQPWSKYAKYLLRGIEGLTAWGSAAQNKSDLAQNYYDTNFYTIEHILPRSCVRQWGDNVGGNFWDEHIAWLEDNPEDPLWPHGEGAQTEMRDLRFRLGNHILLENQVNNQSRAKSWAGPGFKDDEESFKRDFAHIPELTNNQKTTKWGKFHVYVHFEWQKPDGEYTRGSHLRAVRNFARHHKNQLHWRETLLNARTEKLARIAKAKEEWKVW